MKSKQQKYLLLSVLLLLPISIFMLLKKLESWRQIALPRLKRLEGFSAKPYRDYTQWSIGYGSFAGKISAPPTIKSITLADGEKKLITLMDDYYKRYVEKNLRVPLNEKQKAALAIYAYNCPAGVVDIIAEINRKSSLEVIKREWLEWHYAGGKPHPGLIERRKDEFNLFIS